MLTTPQGGSLSRVSKHQSKVKVCLQERNKFLQSLFYKRNVSISVWYKKFKQKQTSRSVQPMLLITYVMTRTVKFQDVLIHGQWNQQRNLVARSYVVTRTVNPPDVTRNIPDVQENESSVWWWQELSIYPLYVASEVSKLYVVNDQAYAVSEKNKNATI